MTTVASQYRSAFELIIGHPFSFTLWRRLMGLIKLSGLVDSPDEIASAAVMRRLQAPIPRPVPDSTLAPVDETRTIGTVEALSATVDEPLVQMDLLMDLEDLIRQGLADDEIARRLGVSDAAEVAYWRPRLGELRDLIQGTD